MNDINKYSIRLFLAVIVIITTGTFGYYLIEENWTILDSFYMTIITITTVGFGETHQLSALGRLFTVVIILSGFGIIAASATTIAKLMIENELSGVMRRKKMQARIQKLSDHYIICGFGRIGSTIALKLHESGIKFVAIEIDPELIEIAKQRDYPYIVNNAHSDAALIDAGIERAAGIIVCTSNESDNLFITLAARELNPDIYIIVRSDDTKIEQRILRAGANRVVYPMMLGGEQIANVVSRKMGQERITELSGIDINDLLGYTLKKYTLYESTERTVTDILHKTKASTCIAFEDKNHNIIDSPPSNQVIAKGETLLLLTKNSEADFLATEDGDLINWNNKLSLGISSIDLEHKKLVSLANELAVAIIDGEGHDLLKSVLDKLLEYTASHFKNEEALFQKFKYPEMENHVEEHRLLTQQVMNLHKEINLRFAGNIVEFLESWLVDHILSSDMKYSKYLRNRGVE